MPDPVVFGPELERPSPEQLLVAEWNSVVDVLRPHVEATMRAVSQLCRDLAPVVAVVMAVRSGRISAAHRDYRRRTLARRRRR